MTIGQRLKLALKRDKERSVYSFQKEMERRSKDDSRITGTSQPAIYRYLRDEITPSVEFLTAAADLLEVRPAWLLVEDGPMTPEDADFNHGKLLRHGEQFHMLDQLEKLPLGPGERNFMEAQRTRAALIRFAHKLEDADFPGAPFSDIDDRITLLRMAMQFLISVESVFGRVGRHVSGIPQSWESEDQKLPEFRDDLLQGPSSSAGWYVAWSDAVLDLFARRVKGLGERGNEFWDAHEPMYPHTTDGMIEYNRQQSEKPNALHPMWHSDGKNPEYVETPDGDGEQEP